VVMVAFSITFRLAVGQLWSSSGILSSFFVPQAELSTFSYVMWPPDLTADIASRVSQEEVQWAQ
jgi:hypothetical protein